MKESNYNFIYDTNDGKKLAFNAVSCSLAEVDNSFLEILKNINNINIDNVDDMTKDLIFNMHRGSYIVDDDFDEKRNLRIKYNKGKFANNHLSLTIAPTLMCNFKCPYCYETPNNIFIDHEVENALINTVQEYANNIKKLDITWYGGEPLLAKEIIWRLSKGFIDICNRFGVQFASSMITNGYLIDNETINRLLRYNINNLQITIDGPSEIHDTRRILKDNTPTFNKIIENVKKLKENKIRVSIRVNVDKTNVQYLDKLVTIFKENGFTDLDVNLGQVISYTAACSSIKSNCLGSDEYADVVIYAQEMLYKNGFKVLDYPYYPGVKGNYCCADQINSFVIDPNGYMYKCWNDIGMVENSVGNIKDINKLGHNNNSLFWLEQNPFKDKECIQCKFLPLCMGGCPYLRKSNRQHICDKWKHNLKETILNRYKLHSNE